MVDIVVGQMTFRPNPAVNDPRSDQTIEPPKGTIA